MKEFKNAKKNVGASIARPHFEEFTKRKNETGITLIALIITIIVMLILVAVSIRIALSTGLFESAGKAGKDWKTVQEAEGELGAGKVTIGNTIYNNIDEYLSELSKEHNWQYTDNTMATLKCECTECKKINAAGVTYSIGQEIEYTAGPEGTEWVVFGVEDCDKNETNETLLITTLEPSEESLTLGGADAYNNGIAKIEAKVKEIYGNEARAMTIDDVNRTLGYTPEGGDLKTKLKDLGETWTNIVNVGTNNYNGVFYTPAHPEGISDNGAELGEYVVLDRYDYSYDDMPESTSMIPKKLVFGVSYDGEFCYWLASRGVDAYSDMAGFGPAAVFSGHVNYCFSCFYSNSNHSYNTSSSLRALLPLKSGVPEGGKILVDGSDWNYDNIPE